MKKYLLFFMGAGILLFPSCKHEKMFHVKGEIASANEKMVYLEHRGLDGVKMLDSTKLTAKGAFSFKHAAPANPEFYQLRIGDKVAVFAVDSIETLQIKADAANFPATFVVENSPANDQMKQVDKLYVQAVSGIKNLENRHSNKSIDDVAYLAELDSLLSDYKISISNLILGNPPAAAAYYAVFQKIDDYLIFDPYNRKDYAMFGAVATSWDRYYPGTPRTKHLYDFTMNALKVRKQEEKQIELLQNASVVTDSGLPDIVLTNVSGAEVSLSSLKGKVVLLDFTVYKAEFSPKHNIELNTLYKRFKGNGFEIYQISFDSDDHFWKNAASNLPWVTVHDAQSVYSSLLSTYNVRNLPAAFIINSEGDVVARIDNYNALASELGKVL